MKTRRRTSSIALALYANAAVLLAILLALLARGGPSLAAPAFAEPAAWPIAGGSGIYVMPCQFHANVWGCYLMDVDRQTLCAYEYRPGEKSLTLTAARNFKYDLQLKNVGTDPSPFEIQKLVEEQEKSDRVTGSKSAVAPPQPTKDSP